MSRIAASLSGTELLLLNKLAQANAAATLNSLRLTTGRRINSPADDPSGFVAVAQYETQLSSVRQVIRNVSSANTVVSQASLALDAVRTQLGDIRAALLADEDGSLDAAERAEQQAVIDAALAEIASIAESSSGDGQRLVDGSRNFRTTGMDSSEVRSLEVISVAANGQTISGEVLTTAQQATLTYTGAAGLATADATFTLTGKLGSATIAVANNDPLDDVADAINAVSHQTGVTAAVDGNDLNLSSVDYGSRATVGVAVASGTFNVTGGTGGVDNGTDATARINGVVYSGASSVDGNRFTVNANGLHFYIEFADSFTGQFDTITIDDQSVLNFALSDDPVRLTSLALPGVAPAYFSGRSGSLLDLASGGSLAGLGDNVSQAIRVVDESLVRLARIEGRVNGVANAAIAAAGELSSDLEEDLVAAIESIDKTDDIKEEVLLAKNQALANNAIASLAILSQQRTRIVDLIQQIAGL
jgi:flagellin